MTATDSAPVDSAPPGSVYGAADPAGIDFVVAAKEPIAEGVTLLTLARRDGLPAPRWEPGAHVDLMLSPDLVRQYSLCRNAPEGGLQVAVLREQRGRGGSAYVHDRLGLGEVVRVRGPRNTFPLVDSPRYLFIAGGIGITPILPMIATVSGRSADWQLLYGGRTRATMAFAEELRAAHGTRVRIHPQDECGLLDLETVLGSPDARTAVYCCGPEPLLAAVEQRCASWPPRALHVERFAPRAAPGGVENTTFSLELARAGLTLQVPADRSILQVVEAAGVEPLFSCLEGVCGTCETAVLDGEPDHRDSLLSEAEREAGDVMFICVSRARSAKLVLDL